MKTTVYRRSFIAFIALCLVMTLFAIGASAASVMRPTRNRTADSDNLAEETADENGMVGGDNTSAPGTGEFGDDTSNNGANGGSGNSNSSANGGSSGNATDGANTMPSETTDKTTNRVENAVDDVVDGAENAVDDMTDGMSVWSIVIIVIIIAVILVLVLAFFTRRK